MATPRSSVETRVAELDAKLRTEYQVLDGANKMLEKLTDENARAQCEASIREVSRRIDYLEGEKARLLGTPQKPSLASAPQGRQASATSLSQSSLFGDQSPPAQPQSGGRKLFGGLFSSLGRKDKGTGQTLPAPLPTAGSVTSLVSSGLPSRQNSGFLSGTTTPHATLMLGSGMGAAQPSSFEYWLLDSPLTSAKIKHKLREVRYKLDVEQKVKAGTERLLSTLQNTGAFSDDIKQRILDVKEKLAESGGKVVSLQKALQKYQGLWVGPEEELWADVVDESQSPGFNQSDGAPAPHYPAPQSPGPRTPTPLSATTRKLLSGKLRVTFIEAQDLPFRKSLSTDVYAAISVDNLKATTKGMRTPKWNETLVMDLERSGEVEITIVEKDAPESTPLCVAWFRLSELDDELKSVALGLMRSSGLGGGDMGAAALGADQEAVQRAAQQLHQLEKEGVETWVEMEPSGKLLVKLNFVSEEPRKKDQELAAKDAAAVGLKRARPVRKLFYKRGHKFEPKQFYQIMRCATCGEFLLTTAYQCVQCKYTCHKACHERVLAKCITKSEGEKDEDEGAAAAAIMKHNIPHRFEKASTMTPQWCSHCGYMMPFGLPRKQIMRCSECPVLCHEGCMPLIPNLCGMSTEVAQNMMEAIEQAERRKQERTRTSQQGYAGSVEVRAERLSLDGQPAVSPEEDLARSQRTAGVSGPVTVPAPTLPGPPPSISISETPMAPPVSAPARVSSLSPTTRASAPQAPVISVSPVSVDKPQYGYPSPPAVRPPEGVVGTVSNATSVVSEASTSAVAVAPAPREPTKKRSKPSVGLDDFHFLAVLGKGNFGKVMLAEEKLTGNLYAIKVLKKDFIIKNDEVESVKSEKRVFQTANVARHPFLVNLHSCFQTETRVYFVMEYVSGGDLMWHIQHHQFSEKRAKFYACEVLLAIEYFHQNNIVYRDLKLDNILLTTSGHIKLADYGLCKENMGFGCATNTFCGTPEFMAPEILMEKPYGRAVDWWAFGVLIYEMLLGQSPFKGEDEDEIFEAILEDEILYPANMNRDAVSILQKLLTKDPAKRLGAGRTDAEEVKRHPFFKGVDWDAFFRLAVPPPYVPKLVSSTDISNFDEEFTKLRPVLTLTNSVLHPADQEEFRGFTYVSEWAQENRSKAVAEGRTKAPTPTAMAMRYR